MNSLKIISRIKELYLQNENIINYLKKQNNRNSNTIEDILISYDFQAGSYISDYKKNPGFKDNYCKHLARVINELGSFESLMEAGIGEATTFGPTLNLLDNKPLRYYGFDISWSRLKYAKKFLNELNINNVNLFTGDLFTIPIKDNSIDIVYTSHSIEPNGGKETEALEELYRITNKYLVLLEPSYEFANEQARARMIEHGYITKLYSTAKELGYHVIEHRLFDTSVDPLNPTGLLIIQKPDPKPFTEQPLCCPITKKDIVYSKGAYFSEESLLAYPVINEIPCLVPQNAILATKFLE